MSQPTPADVLRAAQWFAPDGDRQAFCRDCGEPFTQHKLSDRFLAMARALPALAGQPHAIDREIPDGYVPTLCPPCEDRALTAESTHVPAFVPMRKGSRTPRGAPEPHEPVTADEYWPG